MENEIWKDVVGYEGYYLCSNYGRIKSIKTGKVLKSYKTKVGYLINKFCKNGAGKTLTNHRLIAKSFIQNPENKPCVNHKNGIKTDNRIENLEWVTISENVTHGYRTLNRVHPRGSLKHGKYTKENVGRINPDKLFDVENINSNLFCKTCKNRSPQFKNKRMYQFCGVRKSNHTKNGLLKIKCKRKACTLYESIWEVAK